MYALVYFRILLLFMYNTDHRRYTQNRQTDGYYKQIDSVIFSYTTQNTTITVFGLGFEHICVNVAEAISCGFYKYTIGNYCLCVLCAVGFCFNNNFIVIFCWLGAFYWLINTVFQSHTHRTNIAPFCTQLMHTLLSALHHQITSFLPLLFFLARLNVSQSISYFDVYRRAIEKCRCNRINISYSDCAWNRYDKTLHTE